MSFQWRLVGVVLPLLLPSCWLMNQNPPPESGHTETAKELRAEAALTDEAAILQARVGIGVGSNVSSVVDFEVSGPGRAAKQVCEALVQKELATVYPPETNIKAQVLRTCDLPALLEPEAKSSYALVRVSRMSGVEMRLELLSRADLKVDSVQVRKRELSGYNSQDSCEADLLKIREAQEKAMRDGAMSFLEEQIVQQEKRSKEHCAKGKDSTECRNSESLLGILKERRSQVDRGVSRGGVTMVCRRW